jgi:hypothetical protein
MGQDAAQWASTRVAAVRDDPHGRLALLASLYENPSPARAVHLPYRRAAMAFMRWQMQRGLLNPTEGLSGPGSELPPGSPWWRTVNERLLCDTAEARAILRGTGGSPSSTSTALSLEFARKPSARSWYRAHNASIVAAYLEHEPLAAAENLVERFFINLVLVRVLYAHALVAAPRLALGWWAPIAPLLGDPRLGMTGTFLSLSRVLPDYYPLRGQLAAYVEDEHGFGRLLDVGLIRPRLAALFEWSAAELGAEGLATLATDGVPSYAWTEGPEVWNPEPSLPARAVRLVIPRW